MQEPINPYAPPAAAESALMVTRRNILNGPMRRVATGLGILRAAQFLYIATIVGFYSSDFLALALHSWGPASRVGMLSTALLGLGKLLALVGVLFCFGVPSESKALGWVQAAAITGILAWVVNGAGHVPGVVRGTVYLRTCLDYASSMAMFAALFYLSGWLQRSDFARRASVLLKLYGVVIALNAVYFGLKFANIRFDLDVPPFDFHVLRIVCDVPFLLVAVRAFVLLSGLRSAIQSSAGPDEMEPESNDAA